MRVAEIVHTVQDTELEKYIEVLQRQGEGRREVRQEKDGREERQQELAR